MTDVTFPSEFGGDGKTYSDASFRSGGHRVNFIPALINSLAMAEFAKSQAEDAKDWRDEVSDFLDTIDPFQPTTYRETLGDVSGTTVELNTGNIFFDEISSSLAYTFSNPPPSGIVYSFTLVVKATGSSAITWPSTVLWPGGVSPVAPLSGDTSVYVFFTADGGDTYYGFVSGEEMS